MGHTLESFAADCHRLLEAEPGPAGREKVVALVREVLQDPGFVKATLGGELPERKILYEDPTLGFCILAHHYQGAKNSKPHDHGPSWAIYGQAEGETIMTDWSLISRPEGGAPGKVKHVRDYALRPGEAYLYNEGDLHSPRRDASTRLLRMEGMNMEKVKRDAFEVAA